MGKAVGVVAVAFVLGGGAMTLLGGLFGTHAEAAALALVGVGLLCTGQALSTPQRLSTRPSGSARVG